MRVLVEWGKMPHPGLSRHTDLWGKVGQAGRRINGLGWHGVCNKEGHGDREHSMVSRSSPYM